MKPRNEQRESAHRTRGRRLRGRRASRALGEERCAECCKPLIKNLSKRGRRNLLSSDAPLFQHLPEACKQNAWEIFDLVPQPGNLVLKEIASGNS